MNVEFESMNNVFKKFHLKDHGLILHRFWGPDEGDPHDHNFDIHITILEGGYAERVWQRDGSNERHVRKPGDQFVTAHDKIHRIEALLDGPCLTLTSYGPKVQEPGFWRWIDGVAQRRQWDGDWLTITP